MLTPPIEGKVFAGYHLLSQLGKGGMGEVFKARQPVLVRLVALKIVKPELAREPGYVERLHQEAAAAAKFNHPNIVQIYTAGEADGTHFIVMEYVEGESLNDRLKREGRLDFANALEITLSVARALRYGWERARIIHRDVKPDNIFLSVDGEVKLGDLGLAKSLGDGSASLTEAGQTLGTPYYCSPEQVHGEKNIDARADIYSLGCTLYHMLTGAPPYEHETNGSPVAVMMRHLNDPVPDISVALPGCPDSLVKLIRKMLAKSMDDRHFDYVELMSELEMVRDSIKPHRLNDPAGATRPKSFVVQLIPWLSALVAVALAWQFGPLIRLKAAKEATPAPPPAQTTTAPRANVAANPTFAESDAAGDPTGWSTEDGVQGKVVKENGVSFLRISGAAGAEAFYLQYLNPPREARKANVYVKLRSPDFASVTHGDYGMVIAQRDEQGEIVGREIYGLHRPSTGWRELSGTIELSPRWQQIALKVRIYDAAGTADFAEVRVEPY
jgi:tRNA A-37 threonylcarbamoyl transferase component Bud32